MKRKSKIALRHLFIWLVLSLIYFFTAETITVWIYPEVHDVVMWLAVLIIGLIVIFIGIIVSMITMLGRNKVTIKS